MPAHDSALGGIRKAGIERWALGGCGFRVAAILGFGQVGAERHHPFKRRPIDGELYDDAARAVATGDVAPVQNVAKELVSLESWRVARWFAVADGNLWAGMVNDSLQPHWGLARELDAGHCRHP